MATKKKSEKTAKSAKRGKEVKQLRATVATLEARLERAGSKAAGWKTKAKDARAGAAAAEKKVAELEKRLATRSAATPEPAAGPAGSPDASWTVTRLRAEARERGLTGMSNKPKADLLAALG